MKLEIDPSLLTMGDLEDIETALGGTFDAFTRKLDQAQLSMGDFTMKELNALVWVFARVNEPGLTLDDVRRMKLTELEFGRPPVVAGSE